MVSSHSQLKPKTVIWVDAPAHASMRRCTTDMRSGNRAGNMHRPADVVSPVRPEKRNSENQIEKLRAVESLEHAVKPHSPTELLVTVRKTKSVELIPLSRHKTHIYIHIHTPCISVCALCT